MAKKPEVKKPEVLIPAPLALLPEIVEYLRENPGCDLPEDDYADEIAAGLILVINGKAYLPGDEPNDSEPVSAAVTKYEFSLEDNIVIPKITRPGLSGKRGSKYPIDIMQIGQSFLIPTEAGKTDAEMLKLGRTVVNNANFIYKSEVPGEFQTFKGKQVPKYRKDRYFMARLVPGGVRIWRMPVDTTEDTTVDTTEE